MPFRGGIVMGAITYFYPLSGSDVYINYKMTVRDKLGSDGRPGCEFIGWGFVIL